MTTNHLRRAYRFFHEHGGQLVGRQAEIAIRLARAEAWLDDRDDLTFEIEPDPDCDLGDHEYWCNDARHTTEYPRGKCEGHECVMAAIMDADGMPLASLGGIIDPSSEYLRVIRAELAQEARDEIEVESPDVVLSEN